MLKGRLGLDTARIPHRERHGLLWLERGVLNVVDGCLHFSRQVDSPAGPCTDQIPHQSISMILLGPGSSVTHDALRLLARHGTLLAAVGADGVRSYTAPPLQPDRSDVARRQVELWAEPKRRLEVARRMYALRLGEVLPHRDINTLRGIEGARVKTIYRAMAARYGIEWAGRRYDRDEPEAADLPNQAINHAATAVQAAASIACQSLGCIPQLGFIHEDSGQAFVLDIADLYRDKVTLAIAFTAAKQAESRPESIDRLVRREAAREFRRSDLIPDMINKVQTVLQMEALREPGDGHND